MNQFMEAPVRNVLVLESCLRNSSFALLSMTLIFIFKGVTGRIFTSSASVGENGCVESDFGGEVFSGWCMRSLVISAFGDVRVDIP